MCDLYINGVLVQQDIADSFAEWDYGSTYEFTNIRIIEPYVFDGVASGSLSGTIPIGGCEVWLKFTSVPGKPGISVSASDDLHEVVFSWGDTANTDWYDVRIYNGAGENIWVKKGYQNTQMAALLPAGDYQVDVASVSETLGSWTFSDRVAFNVGAGSLPSAGTLAGEIIGNHELYRVYSGKYTWLEAEALAKVSGGRLVEIDSSAENDVVTQLIANAGLQCLIGAESFRNNEWRWASGTPMNYTNWHSGEPNNAHGIECCAEMDSSGMWNDIPNGHEAVNGYVVEYLPVSVTVAAKQPVYPTDYAISKADLTVEVRFEDGTTVETDDYTFSAKQNGDNALLIAVQYGSVGGEAVVATAVGGGCLKLPAKMKTIEEEAFANINAFIIEIPDGCTSISSKAFANNPQLARIYIPESVKNIAFDAFTGCDNLTIYAPANSKAVKMASALGIPCVITE